MHFSETFHSYLFVISFKWSSAKKSFIPFVRHTNLRINLLFTWVINPLKRTLVGSFISIGRSASHSRIIVSIIRSCVLCRSPADRCGHRDRTAVGVRPRCRDLQTQLRRFAIDWRRGHICIVVRFLRDRKTNGMDESSDYLLHEWAIKLKNTVIWVR